MGKRTKDKTDDEILRKIQRLEKELNSRKGSLPPTSPILRQIEDREWDSLRSSPYNYQEEANLDNYACENAVSDTWQITDSPENEVMDLPADSWSSANRSAKESNDIQSLDTDSVAISSASKAQTEDVIPDEIMEMLGEAKKSEETFGKKIPQGVSERLGKILIEGLVKDQKEKLLTNTLTIPENFQLVKAPKLNPEVASILTDPARNRDKRLEKLQNQLGSGIAGLVNLTSDLINNDLDKTVMIKRISEVNQVLLDLHYEETMGRRRIIMPMLDKNFINIVQNVKRDMFLFGDNLGDDIKTTKSIERSSLQIKKCASSILPSTSQKSGTHSGNFRAPARHVAGPGPSYAQPSTSRHYPPPPRPATRRPPPVPRRPPPARGYPQDYRTLRR